MFSNTSKPHHKMGHEKSARWNFEAKKRQSSSTQKKCGICGNTQMIPAGTCYVCQICGTSMGCS